LKKIETDYLILIVLPFQILKILFTLLVFLGSCSGKQERRQIESNFTETTSLSYAKRLKIEVNNGYSQLSVINPWQGADDVIQKWYLVPLGEKVPVSAGTSAIIRIPVKKIVCMSTTHLAMIAILGEVKTVSAFSGTRFIYSPDISQLVKEGKISETGYEDNLNKELLIKINPDVVMVYGIGSESAGYVGKLRELGLRVIYNADYLETDPLGKAEWIRMIGALYAKQEMADSIFKGIEERYLRIKEYIRANAKSRPKVMLGLPFKDTWYISPGNSYISTLISDAGGEYLWADTESSFSMPVGLENVFLKSLKADYWLNTGNAFSLDEIRSVDPRFAELPCFKTGNIFNNNKRINVNGGNDYWESGSVNPDLILRDLAFILHPELFREHELYYYRHLK
jgi:iron complex transport system substrate-binding protein